jgi:hypothetical protein
VVDRANSLKEREEGWSEKEEETERNVSREDGWLRSNAIRN